MTGRVMFLFLLATSVAASGSSWGAQRSLGTPGSVTTNLPDFLEQASQVLDIQLEAGNLEAMTFSAPDFKHMDPDEARKSFFAVLNLQGWTALYDETLDLYRVMRQRDARDQAIPLVTDAAKLPNDDRMIIYRQTLSHILASDVARSLRSFAPANSRLLPDEANNAISITDSARAMTKYRKLIASLDIPGSSGAARGARHGHREEKPCPSGDMRAPVDVGSFRLLLTALFTLIGLLIGFIARGYVIRRIEGGL